jgi:hypothetical protein
MIVILVVAVLLVFQKHKVAHSSGKMAASSAAEMPKSSPAKGLLAGKVKETMDSGGYTYVLLETKDGEKWVAAPKTVVKVGQEISFTPGMVMKNFKSETLNRTFPEVVFSPGVAGSGAAGGMAAMGGSCPSQKGDADMAPHGGGMGGMGAMSSSGRVVVPPLDLKIDKAEGENAYTVAELYTQGKTLDKKKVKVRGKVVKVSPNIMGKNWIHLQDGSGEPAKGTHDLVVTSQEKPEVGKIVVVEGVLEADKDFGAGYRYDVIIEEGVFKK